MHQEFDILGWLNKDNRMMKQVLVLLAVMLTEGCNWCLLDMVLINKFTQSGKVSSGRATIPALFDVSPTPASGFSAMLILSVL